MINHFLSVKELLSTLHRGHKVIAEIFEKRKSLAYKFDDALRVMEDNEEVIKLLCSKGILRENGQYLEIDDQYLQFFEQVLGVNEDINTSYVNEHIKQIKDEFMLYYLQSSSETEKYKYLKQVKTALRKIGSSITRNIIDLNRNIENAFKTEPSYKIKLLKLENYKTKLVAIQQLIEQTELLINEDELTFFAKATDLELKYIKSDLGLELTEARQNLIETRKQIIEYINQIKYQSKFLEKLRQLKYLKEQFEIKHKTNILDVLSNNNSVIFDSKPYYPVRFSLDKLEDGETREIIKKLAKKHVTGTGSLKKVADDFTIDDIKEGVETKVYIDLQLLLDDFSKTDMNLFEFLSLYEFKREVPFEEKITLYCQIVSIFDNQLEITDQFSQDKGIEYALVYNLKLITREYNQLYRRSEKV